MAFSAYNGNVNFGDWNPQKVKRLVGIAAGVIFLIVFFSTCWFTVNDKQQAVITTFGRVTGTADAGIHFKLPFGIQKAELVDINVYHKIELGYRSDPAQIGDYETIENESKMISGDFNIVNVDFFIEYKISNAEKYLYAAKDPDTVLKNLAQSQIRNVIGSKYVDDILTTGKSQIQAEVKELITEELAKYDVGIVLTDIKIQDAEPPTEEVNAAFKNVETAKQVGETAKNDAEAYKNAQIQNAEFKKLDRINQAKKQVAMFDAMYEQYAVNREITKSRMYFEAIEAALPNVKLYIDAAGTTQKLLPLENFLNLQTGSTANKPNTAPGQE